MVVPDIGKKLVDDGICRQCLTDAAGSLAEVTAEHLQAVVWTTVIGQRRHVTVVVV